MKDYSHSPKEREGNGGGSETEVGESLGRDTSMLKIVQRRSSSNEEQGQGVKSAPALGG